MPCIFCPDSTHGYRQVCASELSVIIHINYLLDSRVCRIHLDDHGLLDFTPKQFAQTKKAFKKIPMRLVHQLEVMYLLTRVSCQQFKDRSGRKSLKMINFDDSRMSESDYITLTGVKKVDFDELVTEHVTMRQSKRWSRRNSIGLYLTRIRTGSFDTRLRLLCILSTHTGWSMSTLSCLFGSRDRRHVSQRIRRIRDVLMASNSIMSYIGCSSMPRQTLIDVHTSAFGRIFFGVDEKTGIPRPIVVIDGLWARKWLLIDSNWL